MLSDEESNRIFYRSLRQSCTYEVGMSIGSRCSSRCDKPAVQFLKSQRFIDTTKTIFDAFCQEHSLQDCEHEMFTHQARKTVRLIDAEEYHRARKENPRIYYNSGVDELGLIGLQEYVKKLEAKSENRRCALDTVFVILENLDHNPERFSGSAKNEALAAIKQAIRTREAGP